MSLDEKPRVLVADDSPAMLDTVQAMLAAEFNVVAAVNDGLEAVEAAAKFRPDIFILDITMPGLDGFRTAREIRRLGLSGKVIFLTVNRDADYVNAACAMGASYVVKSRMYSDLNLAIREGMAGRTFVSPVGIELSTNSK
ncbi:MAG TPA: response regulator transcription factor [Terriglobales bacterium]